MVAKSGRIFALAALTLLISSSAYGASQRTFVSASGVDNPNCSLAAPCRSFATAIAAMLSGGEVIVLDSAGYGPVTITKSASIIAPPGIYAGITVFAGNGITVNATGGSVVLRGLTINGLGGDAGIVIQNAGQVRIEHCVVSGMSQMGIFHQATDAQVAVSDTIVRDNAQEGIRMVTDTGSITLDRGTIERNHTGLYVSPNVATGQLDATISDSLIARNATNGIWADAGANATVYASVDRSTIAENSNAGVVATASSSAVVSVSVQRSTLRRNRNRGIAAIAALPAVVDVNASDNVLHLNVGGTLVDGSGVLIRASGNSFDGFTCQGGAILGTYKNNSVKGTVGCVATTLDPF